MIPDGSGSSILSSWSFLSTTKHAEYTKEYFTLFFFATFLELLPGCYRISISDQGSRGCSAFRSFTKSGVTLLSRLKNSILPFVSTPGNILAARGDSGPHSGRSNDF
jgi:hypothetical protein